MKPPHYRQTLNVTEVYKYEPLSRLNKPIQYKPPTELSPKKFLSETMNILGQLPFFGFPPALPPLPPLNFPPFPIFHPGHQMQMPLVQHAPQRPFMFPQMPLVQHAPQMPFMFPQMPVAQGFYQAQPPAFHWPAQPTPLTINIPLHLCRCLQGQGAQGQQNGQPIAPQAQNQAQNNQAQNNQAQNNQPQNAPVQQNQGNAVPPANPQPAQNVYNVNGGLPIRVNLQQAIPQPQIPPPPPPPPPAVPPPNNHPPM
jgi:hypothetical protein